jgi:D-alanyl-D-alanine carboxypeptidase
MMLTTTSLTTLGCGQTDQRQPASQATTELRSIVESAVEADDTVHGAAVAVVSPSRGLAWEGAAGFADPEAGTPMTPGHPVRIASNTKTYTAAAVLRLAEDGRLDIDSPIADHLPDELLELLSSGSYDPAAITIRHLLTHSAGLDDHGAAGEYTEAIIADPQHEWTPAEQIAGLVQWGSKLGDPGEVYSYSDSGYVLLGVIIEQASGRRLGPAVRDLIDFEALGLGSTWWEVMEPRPQGVPQRAHQFLGELDAHSFYPTFDLYGGGGIATTMSDLAVFFDALVRGRVFHDPTTLETMLSTFDGLQAAAGADERSLPPGAYRMGLWVTEIGGRTAYQHTGFWSTSTVHVPELDLTIAGTVNQHEGGESLDRAVEEVVRAVGGLSAG